MKKQQPLALYKEPGLTPLQALEQLRRVKPEYKNAVISYAGRLDPMAEGIMLVLVGAQNKDRKEYLHLDKEYILEILFGFETDTYDILGIVSAVSDSKNYVENPEQFVEKIELNLKKYTTTFLQSYPPYSSKTVNGKALFKLAREHSLPTLAEIPTKEVTIYSVNILDTKIITAKELLTDITERISKVNGDFRQQEIISIWKNILTSKNIHTNINEVRLVRVAVACSSGTYMRSLAHAIGRELGCGAIAYKIIRTKVGTIDLTQALHIS